MSRKVIIVAAALILAACTKQDATRQPAVNGNRGALVVVNHPPDLTGWPIYDRNIRRVGTVTTRLQKQGILVSLDTMGLPPGVHGVHIHEVPKCEAPTFESAGAHWNWTNKKHGHSNPEGYHAGDLGNLTVDSRGKGEATFMVAAKDWDPKLTGGLPLIIHAQADDNKTDPSGNSGERIACGVLYLRRD